jgi:hypothetical protein
LRLVLQDFPHQLKVAEEEVWPERCPEALSENRIEFIPLDFFKGPPKQNCDIYLVRISDDFEMKTLCSSST